MLDRKFIVENADAVQKNCTARGVDVDVARFINLYDRWKQKQTEVDELNRQANAVSKTIGQAKTPEDREARKAEGRRLREEGGERSRELDALAEEMDELHRQFPNMTHPDAPHGADDTANRVLRYGKTEPRQFDFQPLDHVELGERLDLFDFEAGAKVAGHGFYFLKNDAVLLDLALQRYALDMLRKEDFVPVVTPDLARNEVLHGTGYMPRGPETQIYSIENSDLSLIATAEITLGGLHAQEILPEEQLPLFYCGISHCYRTEAGAHGKATRGLYRVHQFTKVEMFAFTRPEESDTTLERLCALECALFDGLEVPYQVVDTATGDLGGPAYRKYDLEAWMPGRGDAGEYGEVTSTSNCTDFQARRLGIRFRPKEGKGTQLVHTLNGTAIAVSRALIAVLENGQQADGSITIPVALVPYFGQDQIAPPAK